jgi:hypothetical protein
MPWAGRYSLDWKIRVGEAVRQVPQVVSHPPSIGHSPRVHCEAKAQYTAPFSNISITPPRLGGDLLPHHAQHNYLY